MRHCRNRLLVGFFSTCPFIACATPAHADEDRTYAGIWAEHSKSENKSVGAYLLFAPSGNIAEPGERIQAFASYDRYYYNDLDGAPVTGETTEFDALAGLAIELGKVKLTALAGPAITIDKLSSAGGGDASDTSLGLRLSVDSSIFFEGGTSLEASARYKTTREDYSVSSTLQFPVWKSLKFGPTAQLKGNASYDEVKLGAAISGFQVAGINLKVIGGVSLQDNRESAYFGLSTWSGF